MTNVVKKITGLDHTAAQWIVTTGLVIIGAGAWAIPNLPVEHLALAVNIIWVWR